MFGNKEVEENVLCSKWINFNEDLACNIGINGTNAGDLKI
jgi:hypothetical protein